jgi:glycosyltransferase involved in cell wall biosynthesis
MSDNIFHGSLKQWLGAIYFRLRLRKGYDAALVPGVRGAQFLRFLGMTQSTIRTGLYASDPAIFRDDGRQKNGECIFVGQLIERKGIRELVPAAKRLGILQRITFYGVGKLRKWMLEQGCRIQGFIQPSELGEVLRNHSILVLPSRLDHWPLAVHEGALAGCALIVSDKTGSAYDFIINQENGCVFRTGSSTSLEASMKWMLEQPSQWFDNARKLSHERAMAFTPEKCASIMEEIYRTTQNGKLK